MEPTVVTRYQGPETDANQQTMHFPGLLRAGNGNLIALYRLRPDELVPKETDLREYSKDDVGYQISHDNGKTWDKQRTLSYGGLDGGTLRDGTVSLPWLRTWWVNDHELRAVVNRSNDGGRSWTLESHVPVYFPIDRNLLRGTHDTARMTWWCTQMLALDGDSILATMNGSFANSSHHVAVLLKSDDAGRSWHFVSEIGGQKQPHHQGYYGTAIDRLPDGSLLAVIQTLYANPRILVQSRSVDEGKTWTDPIVCPGIPGLDPATLGYTTPAGRQAKFDGAYKHPSLLRLSNGVLALTYGRPGIQVAFSTDGTGQRWDRIETIVPLGPPYSYSIYDATSGKPAFVELDRDRLLLLYDVYEYAKNAGDTPVNTVFMRELMVADH